MTKPASVEAYLAQFDGEILERLKVMQQIVREEAPDAVESMSYGIIGYKLAGKPLVYIGGFANHVGLYATPNGHAAFADEFASYKQGKGSVQFPLSKRLPVDLIRRVICHRKNALQ